MTTQNEMIKELRAYARDRGQVFKKQDAYINSKQAYKIEDKSTGEVVASNYTLVSAYNEFILGA